MPFGGQKASNTHFFHQNILSAGCYCKSPWLLWSSFYRTRLRRGEKKIWCVQSSPLFLSVWLLFHFMLRHSTVFPLEVSIVFQKEIQSGCFMIPMVTFTLVLKTYRTVLSNCENVHCGGIQNVGTTEVAIWTSNVCSYVYRYILNTLLLSLFLLLLSSSSSFRYTVEAQEKCNFECVLTWFFFLKVAKLLGIRVKLIGVAEHCLNIFIPSFCHVEISVQWELCHTNLQPFIIFT